MNVKSLRSIRYLLLHKYKREVVLNMPIFISGKIVYIYISQLINN